MSVKVHEAFSIDSFQDRLIWWDDFLGDQLKDEWAAVGAGTIVVVDQQTGGIVRITTGAAQFNEITLYWNNIRSLLVSQRVSMEVRAKVNQLGNTRAIIRLHDEWGGNNEGVNFRYDSIENANWRAQTFNNGASTTVDTGIAADTDYHVFRIECFPTGEVHFYIDGTEVNNSPITTNIPNEHLQPLLLVLTHETATKSMDADYVVVRQEI